MALADDDVEPEVLERRIQHLFHGTRQPVDLVDEEDVSRLEGRQDRRHVAFPLERRAGDAADSHAQLLPHDVGQARLAEPRRPDEQDVVERLLARPSGLQRDVELLLDPLLPDELVELPRAQRALELVLLGTHRGCQELLGHAAFSACRTRSSGGSSGSVPASARSASIAE